MPLKIANDEIGSQPQQQPEPICTGWYWNDTYIIWVIGPTADGLRVCHQDRFDAGWVWVDECQHWVQVHEAVTESRQGFGWRV